MSVIKAINDLRGQMPAVRDQGPRPTCLAFAMSDAHSSHRGTMDFLSVEYLFYHSIQLSHKDPRYGATITNTQSVLQGRGQPLESDWPYSGIKPEQLLGSWSDPVTTQSLFKRLSVEGPADWHETVGSLDDGKPLVAIVDLPRSFRFPIEGVIKLAANEPAAGCGLHAVLIVGSGEVDGQDAVLIRNSWGDGWGDKGHAWMTWTDLSSSLLSVIMLGDDPDVLANTAAA